jgi:hypothetical protein
MTFKKGIYKFIADMNLLINSIIMFLIYFFGVGITSILSKIFGKHFLYITQKDSYWHDINLNKDSIEEYYTQF